MTLAGPEGPVRARPVWWRRRWIWLAAAILVVEVVAVFLLSAGGEPVSAGDSKRTGYRMLVDSGEVLGRDAWGLLMSPSVWQMPSGHDFSARSWLSDASAEVPLEAFLARIQPLPFEPVRGGDDGLGHLGSRLDSGLGGRWTVSGGMRDLPQVPPVPLPMHGGVRLVGGFEGWQLAGQVRVGPLPEGMLVPRAVVRVAIDGTGTPAGPPVIWESSGEPAADQAAIGVVRGLEWVRTDSGAGGEASGRVWGMVMVTWPAPRGSAGVVGEGTP